MINLLPPHEKELLKQEENRKLVLVFAIEFLIFFVSLTLILFAVRTYLADQVSIQKSHLPDIVKNFETPERQAFQKKITSLDDSIKKLNTFYDKQIFFSSLLGKISFAAPSGIYFKALAINTASGKTTCSVTGFALTREILLQFKKNLEANKDFYEITFPPSSWVKPTNIDFDLNFKIK